MLKGNNGVTLVALVITIIVLLILAGVSISLVVGDNGILNQAVNAADETNKAAAKSEIEMAVTTVGTDYLAARYSDGYTGTIQSYFTLDKISANLSEGFTVSDTSGSAASSADAQLFGDGATTDTLYITYQNDEYAYDLTATKNSVLVSEHQ